MHTFYEISFKGKHIFIWRFMFCMKTSFILGSNCNWYYSILLLGGGWLIKADWNKAQTFSFICFVIVCAKIWAKNVLNEAHHSLKCSTTYFKRLLSVWKMPKGHEKFWKCISWEIKLKFDKLRPNYLGLIVIKNFFN